MAFELRRIDLGPSASAGLPLGVIKASDLALRAKARGVLEDARLQAAKLLDEARVDAEAMAGQRLQEREAELARRESELEARWWQSAADYAASLSAEWERSVDELQSSVGTVVRQALTRLVDELPDEARLRACVRLLVDEVPDPDAGVLLVSPEDQAALHALGERVPWPVRPSADLPRGSVRVVGARGRWEADLHGSLQRMLDALGASTSHIPPMPPPETASKE